jgi:hypothetical protein
MSKNDGNTPPESLTLRLKKAETAVEVATVGRRNSGSSITTHYGADY